MMLRFRLTAFLLSLLVAFAFSVPTHAAEMAAEPVERNLVVPADPNAMPMPDRQNAQDDMEPPRAPRKIPEVRDPTRGMYDPHTEREGDARTLDQLSRDRLNLEGKRSRSLNDLTSPLLERRRIDRSRGRLPKAEERTYGTPSLYDRLDVQDSRREYRIDSTREIGEDLIEENGGADYRVYRTR